MELRFCEHCGVYKYISLLSWHVFFAKYSQLFSTIARPVSLPHGLTLRDLVALIPGKSCQSEVYHLLSISISIWNILPIAFRTINSEDWFKTSTLPLSQYYYKPHLTKILRRCGAFEGSKEEFVEECSKLLYQRKMVGITLIRFLEIEDSFHNFTNSVQ